MLQKQKHILEFLLESFQITDHSNITPLLCYSAGFTFTGMILVDCIVYRNYIYIYIYIYIYTTKNDFPLLTSDVTCYHVSKIFYIIHNIEDKYRNK